MPLTATNPRTEANDPQEYLWTLNFGPQHPATHTTLRLILELDGERVIRATPDLGYLHSGFEKIGEHLDYNQYVTVTDRMNYISPMANNVAWHQAVEQLLDIEITPRCQYIRVLVAELARISDHLHRPPGGPAFGQRAAMGQHTDTVAHLGHRVQRLRRLLLLLQDGHPRTTAPL